MVVMREFERWISHRKEKYRQLVDENMRLDAFSLAISSQKRMAAFDFIVKAFELNHEGNDYFVPCVEVYVLKQKYKEVRSVH